LKTKDLNAMDLLDVGIGNGYAVKNLFNSIGSFRAVDISREALEYARKLFPQMSSFENDAEDLKDIESNSVDLYLSFRTYQSTLFDRRASLHEAYRVLTTGGIIIVSIPIMFLKENGEVLTGQIPSGSFEPDMEYAKDMTCRIEGLMKTLNFKDVGCNYESPFEIYVYGRR
jgi:ubiquinone/menaquinone biosynthesis C-methylase UbiE